MGTFINSSPPSGFSDDSFPDDPDEEQSELGESSDESPGLGDLLSGRLDDIDVDSVAAVREQRERR
jgi:hypothetical protein